MGELLAVAVPTPPNPIGPIVDGVGNLIGRGASSIGSSILSAVGSAIARGLADACQKVSDGLLHFLTSSAGVQFSAGWWASDRTQAVLKAVATLAGLLLVAFLLLALIQGLLAGEPTAMLRAALVEVPMSVLGTVVLAAVTELLIGVTDAASTMVLAGAPGDLGHFLSGFGTASTVATGGLAAVLMLIVFLLGAFLVWVELVVRASLLYLLVAFAPLTLAARVWPAAKGIFRRTCELGVALIVAKFGVALALGLGAAALAGGGPTPNATAATATAGVATSAGTDLAGLLGGATLMLLAAFMPFVLLRLLPILEAAVVAQGISRAPMRAGQGGLQAAYYGQGLTRLAGGRTGNPAPSSGGDGSSENGGGPPGRPGGPGGGGPGGFGPGGPVGNGAASAASGEAAGAGAGGAAAGGAAAAVAVPVGVAAKAAGAARDRAVATATSPTPPQLDTPSKGESS